MISKDKFGNPIYPHIFKQLQRNAGILMNLGFYESKAKPNLFLVENKSQGFVFFADMRGTDEVPIWQDTRPLIFIKSKKRIPDWRRKRLLDRFINRLSDEDCECRLSHYDNFLIENGYCKFCGKDFFDEGYYCSEECEKGEEEIYQDHCAVCGKDLNFKNVINHHVNYKEEKTIPVCRSCHMKIHRSKNFPNLKPKNGDTQ